MRQVLFEIPFVHLPVYGYGAMLCIAFLFSLWLAKRLAIREKVDPIHIEQLAIWLLLGGLAGGRITYMIQYEIPISHWYRIWEGGLVLYGAVIGGVIGYFLVHFLILRKQGVSAWKMADIIAPAAAVGIAIGRIGCLLNGCCYGNVACTGCPGVCFPPSGQPRYEMVRRGYQSAAGFTFGETASSRRVGFVEPDSSADRAGLRRGDEILKVNDNDVTGTLAVEGLPVRDKDGHLQTTKHEIAGNDLVGYYMDRGWPRGKNDLTLEVKHANGTQQTLTFTPWSVPLHPTQLYETVSMTLLFLVLWSFYPFKRRDGTVMVLLMMCYAVHRFLDEMLRTDTEPVAFGMTLSENISIAVFSAGVLLGLWIWLRRPQPAAPAPPVVPA